MTSQSKRPKDEQMLMNAAESIGSALGAIAAKAEAATKVASEVLKGRKIAKTAKRVASALRGRKRAPRLNAKRHTRRKASSARAKRRLSAPRRVRRRRS